MAQDLKEMFKKDREQLPYVLKEGHEKRFLKRLEEEMPKKKTSFSHYAIAASIMVLVGLGWLAYNSLRNPLKVKTTVVDVKKDAAAEEREEISFGDLSPDLKKVEEYYVANINLELSQLEVSGDNKALVDSYMERLAELNAAYGNLQKELNEIGPNDHTISALIKNLQLRLQLLQKLKKKLNELKSSKNEQVTTNTI